MAISKLNKDIIDVYSWATPNGHKIHIMLEECGYKLGKDWLAHPIDIGAGDQFKPDFLAISPNNKIPAIIDPNGPNGKPIHLFESGAILLYLAGKTGKFLPKSTQGKYTGDWCRTGDMAVRDEDGYLWYQGRADDVFKASDYRISPFELESTLLEHEAIAETAVVLGARRYHWPTAGVMVVWLSAK